jgi:PLP dependent protein
VQKEQLADHVRKILASLPSNVTLEAAAKTRTAEEVQAVIEAGIAVVGYNYIQEAEQIKAQIHADVRWHLIGHLQKNKVNKAVALFNMIETIDSFSLAELVNRRCGQIGKIMPLLIEVNSGREADKTGVLSEDVIPLVTRIAELPHLSVQGLMTMGPLLDEPQQLRPYFRLCREIYEEIKTLNLPNVEITVLSMGMSDSYLVAIEEGATLVRLGTLLFGPRVNSF